MFARRRIRWPPGVEEHIFERHRLSKYEVDAALAGPVYARRVFVKNQPRYEVLGQVPESGRILKAILEDARFGGVDVVTAMDATLSEKGLYVRRAKGL